MIQPITYASGVALCHALSDVNFLLIARKNHQKSQLSPFLNIFVTANVHDCVDFSFFFIDSEHQKCEKILALIPLADLLSYFRNYSNSSSICIDICKCFTICTVALAFSFWPPLSNFLRTPLNTSVFF